LAYPFVDWMQAAHVLWEDMVFYSEPTLGGLFACNVILYVALFFGYVRKDLKGKGLQWFGIALFAFSFVILVFDAEIVGAVYRYLADYSFAFFLLCVIVLGALWEKVEHTEAETYFRHGLVILSVLSICFNLLIFLSTGLKFPLVEGNTILYYQIENALVFW
jgi:hypothetical protein